MPTSRVRSPYMRFLGATSIVALLAAGCIKTLTVPPPGQDQPPTIVLSNFVVAGVGDVDKSTVNSTTAVSVALGTQLMISGSAHNAVGGVKTFSITVARNGQTLYSVKASAAPDAQNQVPDQLLIVGSDGAGNAGSTVALDFTMTTDPATVIATATNFNGMSTTITATYDPRLPPPPAPTISSYTASPNDGYINVGQSATLAWNVINCATGCTVRMQARDGLNYVDLLSDFPHLPTNGSMVVSPKRATMTRYELTATNPSGSDSKHKVVQLYGAPPPPSGQVFFFKMTNAQSTVTPCFPLAIYAPNEMAGKQAAEAMNGGYTATKITEQEYYAGC